MSLVSIRRECTDITYRVRDRALYSHLAVAALPMYVGWGKRWNLLLVSLLLAYTVGGIASTRWYNARPSTDESARRWAIGLHAQLVGLGILYNLVFVNLARQGVPHAMDYLMLISALFCAGAAASYQYLRGVAVTFIISVMAPQTIVLLVSDPEGGAMTAFLLVVFMVFMSTASLDLHRDAMKRLELTRALKTAKDDAVRLARTDGMTNLLNRRAFLEVGQTLLAGARRDGRPLAVVMLDIDHFKSVNDNYGHATGDAVIVAVADVMRGTKRESDVAGRIGGEEFAFILPNTEPDEAERFAERLRESIGKHAIEVGEACIELTASLGVSEFVEGDADLNALIHRADAALYRAKAEGRDRTIVARPSQDDVVPGTVRGPAA